MTSNNTIDAARVELLLNGLRLSSIRLMRAKLAEQSDKEGWPAARFRAVLAGHEMADRPPPLRAASHRGAAARRQDARHLRSGNLRASAVTTAARLAMHCGLS